MAHSSFSVKDHEAGVYSLSYVWFKLSYFSFMTISGNQYLCSSETG